MVANWNAKSVRTAGVRHGRRSTAGVWGCRIFAANQPYSSRPNEMWYGTSIPITLATLSVLIALVATITRSVRGALCCLSQDAWDDLQEQELPRLTGAPTVVKEETNLCASPLERLLGHGHARLQ